MVHKSDEFYCMAKEYHQLNFIMVFHTEPSCSIEDDLHKFSGSTYFPELDLCSLSSDLIWLSQVSHRLPHTPGVDGSSGNYHSDLLLPVQLTSTWCTLFSPDSLRCHSTLTTFSCTPQSGSNIWKAYNPCSRDSECMASPCTVLIWLSDDLVSRVPVRMGSAPSPRQSYGSP